MQAVVTNHNNQKWHAHLSALSSLNTRRALEAPAFQGVSLDERLLMTPLAMRPAGSDALLSASSGSRDVKMREEDDGSGRQRWLLRAVPDAAGEYNIILCGGGPESDDQLWYLSAPAQGREVDLWYGDDASGRQRWMFKQTGNAKYAVRLAGGKSDDRVFLGVDKSTGGVRLYDSEKNWRLDLSINSPPKTGNDDNDATQDTSPPLLASTGHFPTEVLPRLTTLTGLTERQIDTVLQLISLPENGQPKWWTNYAYIEFLGDGRGFTATLFGACSGTGDLAMILEELAKISNRSKACDELLTYLPVLKKKRGDDIKGIEPIKRIIKGLGDDSAWRKAVWEVYVKLYWNFAMDWADKRGASSKRPGPKLSLPASRGFMVDTSINHGANYESLMYIVKRMKNADAKDEVAWMLDFAETRRKILRSGFEDLDTSKTGDRCLLWAQLFKSNPTLKTPLDAYKGYWGKYTLV